MTTVFGGIESGGTKFVCGIGTCPQDYKNELIIPTSSPSKTLDSVIKYFKEQLSKYSISGIGIGSFGPLDLNSSSKTYGYITTTPKKQWVNTDIFGIIKHALGIPVFIDTDVNAAALGEGKWGAGANLENFIYLTIGTGIGGGGIFNDKLMHGLVHPDGPAIEKRWKKNPKDLPFDHRAWELEAMYIALALVNYICVLSPQRVIIGGGIMNHKHLFVLVRKKVQKLLNNYIHVNEIINKIEDFIVPPQLQNRAGVLGAIALAQNDNSLQCSENYGG